MLLHNTLKQYNEDSHLNNGVAIIVQISVYL